MMTVSRHQTILAKCPRNLQGETGKKRAAKTGLQWSDFSKGPVTAEPKSTAAACTGAMPFQSWPNTRTGQENRSLQTGPKLVLAIDLLLPPHDLKGLVDYSFLLSPKDSRERRSQFRPSDRLGRRLKNRLIGIQGSAGQR